MISVTEDCVKSIVVYVSFREYVSSKTINKVIQVHDQIFCCMAGSLADAQAVLKAAKFHLSFHRCGHNYFYGPSLFAKPLIL